MTRKQQKHRAGSRHRQRGTYAKFRVVWRRVLRIDDMLRSREPCNCTRVARELEVSRRTALRDLDFLRDDLHAPIEYDRTRHTFYYTEPNWSMPNLRISEGDLFALMVAEQALEAYAGTPWAEKLAKVFERITGSLPDRVEVAPRDLLPRVRFDTQAAAAVDPAILADVAGALRGNKTLRIRYYALQHREVREYVIDPYALRRARGAWYLAGRDHRSGRIPMFNLARLRKVRPTGSTFGYENAGFDPKAYFDQTFGVSQTATPFRVVIEFSGFAAELVRERLWHSSQTIKELSGGRLRFKVQVALLDDIWPWVLSWGGEARVVRPKALADRVRQEARRIAANHPEPAGSRT